jgi:hypothetical protein
VSKKRLVSFWSNREQLKSNIIISLSKAIGETPGIGWVRGNIAAAGDILAQINDFRTEVERLRRLMHERPADPDLVYKTGT